VSDDYSYQVRRLETRTGGMEHELHSLRSKLGEVEDLDYELRDIRGGIRSLEDDLSTVRNDLTELDDDVRGHIQDTDQSRLLPPSPASPGSGCPQLHRPAATGRRRRPFTPARITAPHGARRLLGHSRALAQLGASVAGAAFPLPPGWRLRHTQKMTVEASAQPRRTR
jgi:hypothetical protein